jgi:hypothetical protein
VFSIEGQELREEHQTGAPLGRLAQRLRDHLRLDEDLFDRVVAELAVVLHPLLGLRRVPRELLGRELEELSVLSERQPGRGAHQSLRCLQ